jgi:Raf kinase inhibitor-like YbhB/YbcL family protein
MERLFLAASVALFAACAEPPVQPSTPPGVELGSLTVTSKSFAATNNVVPVEYSCDGSNRSPALTWSAPPEGTKSIAIVVEDPDAPNGSFVHWVVYDIKADTQTLPEAFDPNKNGARAGINDNQTDTYYGPCPPSQEMHRYVFRVFALDAELPLPAGKDKAALYAAMRGHVLADGALIATFSH